MKRCLYEYGGRKCGSPAQVTVGVRLPPHQPRMWLPMCRPHEKDHRWLVEERLAREGIELVTVDLP